MRLNKPKRWSHPWTYVKNLNQIPAWKLAVATHVELTTYATKAWLVQNIKKIDPNQIIRPKFYSNDLKWLRTLTYLTQNRPYLNPISSQPERALPFLSISTCLNSFSSPPHLKTKKLTFLKNVHLRKPLKRSKIFDIYQEWFQLSLILSSLITDDLCYNYDVIML